jgi:hypothetical protein
VSWWNPVSWAKDALHDAEDVEEVVIKWVIKEGIKLGDLVAHYAEDLGHDISTGVGWISEDLVDLGVKVAILGDEVAGAAVSAAEGVAGDIRQWVEELVHDAESAWNRIYADVIEPEIKGLDIGLGWVRAAADNAWQIFLRDEWRPALRDAEEVGTMALKAESWIVHAGEDAVKLVEEASDWLLLFAANPLKAVEALPGEVEQAMTLGWALSQGKAVPSLWGDLEAIVEGWI